MLLRVSLTLLGWRRGVAELYARVRRAPDPAQGWSLWREGRDRLFRDHPDSPLPAAQRHTFGGLRYADYDPSLRWTLPVEPDQSLEGAGPQRLEVTTGTDGVVTFERIGVVHLPSLGSLDVWWLTGYGGGVFVPLRDATSRADPGSGTATYGGGRYLLDTVKGADLGGDDTHLVIDLNFAYNPSCAYDAAWACPLAPPGNVLDAPVHAGELAYGNGTPSP
jgi:hypothetical protein